MTASKNRSKWTLGDVLDLESLSADREDSSKLVRERDELAREFAPRKLAEVPRNELFRAWLEIRRRGPANLPGAALDRVFRVTRFLAWALGLALGGSSAGGYLLYFGREPVNPFWFVLWLVLAPLMGSLAIVALARAWHDWSGPGALARWVVGAICRRLPGSARAAWQAWSGTFARHRDRHGRLAVLPLLGITQRVACGFALGALLTLWLRVVFTDIAFGWQSSAGWKMETWHGLARALSAPWTWLFPGACPTLEQVRASHFTYAGGVAALEPGAAQSWWSFLAGCLLVWGVALRGIVILLLDGLERSALRSPDFTHSDGNALYRALTGPLFASDSAAPHPPIAEAGAISTIHAPGRGWLVLAADTLKIDLPGAGRTISACLGGTAEALQTLAVDDSGANSAALAAVAASNAPVAVFLPAARDPILAIKKSLAAILAAAGRRECVLVLLGDAARLPLWRKFAAAQRLELEMISAP